MKNIFLFLFLVPLCTYAQDTTKTKQIDTSLQSIVLPELQKDENGRGKMEITVELPGSKDQLFVKAKEWLFTTYNSGKSVLQMEDKEAGVIIGKGNSCQLIYNNLGIKKDAGYFSYQITIRFKDGKYRCLLDNITYVRGEMVLPDGADIADDFPKEWKRLMAKKYNKKQWDSMKEQAINHFKLLFVSLQTAMSETASKKKDDKW
ncbi:MAG: hypothetical protein OHK0019_00380 [Saprospiraceae bacterium]